MRVRLLVFSVLAGTAVGCGSRTDLVGPTARVWSDAGVNATATDAADPSADATATVDTGAMVEGGATVDTTPQVEGVASDGAACSISASSYDQSCAVDSDCVAVVEVACGGCTCLTGAINRRDLARYSLDRAELAPSAGGATCNCACEPVAPHCCGGACNNFCGPCGG